MHKMERVVEPLEELNTERMRTDFEPGNAIYTLMSEHNTILSFLNKLEKVNQNVQQMENYSKHKDELEELKQIAEGLTEAELHHQQEEEALLVELERKAHVMRMEHEELRVRKTKLKQLVDIFNQLEFNTFKKKLDATVKFTVPLLRDHIFKENNVFYPIALQVMRE